MQSLEEAHEMFNRFMITAATAALIAGTGFAYAQGAGGKEGPASGGAGMQQTGPSSSMSREGAEHGMKSSQTGEKMQPQGAQNQRAQEMKSGAGSEKSAKENMKGEKSHSSQNEKGAAGKDMKAEGREDHNGMKAEGREDRNGMKAEGREDRNGTKAEGREDRNGMKAEGREERNGTKAEGRDNNVNAGSRNAAEGRSETTTGQAGAGARLTTEQRTRISSVIREQHVAPVNEVNFAVSIGTRVPRNIGFHPLPGEIVSIYPEWRGYEFFLARDEIVVVDPRTLEIVAVLPA
jgi:hypothetical protein